MIDVPACMRGLWRTSGGRAPTSFHAQSRRRALLKVALLLALGGAGSAAHAQKIAISLQRGDLETALIQFMEQTRQTLLYRPELVAGRRSPRVRGLLTPEEALRWLLKDTGVTFLAAPGGALLLRASPPENDVPPTRSPQRSNAERLAPTEDLGGEIVVTGTRILGVGPIGSSLMSVGRDTIDATSSTTVQQILKTVPSLSSMGAISQGGGNSAPAIHNLGAVASYSTLVLIDGHRFSLGRQQQPLPDPGIVPVTAIERIEVLADGASSIYGSDAVAGVINVVTRKDYQGFEATGQVGLGDAYRTYSASFLWGTRWETGSVMLTGAYSERSNLNSRDRDFLNPDHTAQSGSNFGSYNCSPAVLQPAGAETLYWSGASTNPITGATAAAPCNQYGYTSAFPAETRYNAMMKLSQAFGDAVTLNIDAVYSDRRNRQPQARGTFQSTAFATGPQANPFYEHPPGYDGNATSQIVRWNADELLGPGAYNTDDSINYYVAADVAYRMSEDWRIDALAMYGHENSVVGSYGTLCGSCANLALNGTTNANGTTNLPSIPGASTPILALPLSAMTALDVWRPASTNRTSSAVRAMLADNVTFSNWFYSTTQLRLGSSARLFDVPGGGVSAAMGIESVGYTIDINKISPNNSGPSSVGSQQLHIPLGRNVRSAYGELLVPIIGPENAMPFVRRVTLNISGRYDHYSDVGSTTNPRIAMDWEIAEGVKVRANWASSFVAPHLSSVGDRSRAGQTSFTGYGPNFITPVIPFVVSTSDFPSAVGLPGCNAGMATCAVPLSTTGINFNGGPANPRPSKGRSWSLGIDMAPAALPGFSLSATLFNVRYINALSGSSLSNALNTPGANLITFYPDGATEEQIQAVVPPFAPLASALPNKIYYILSLRQDNRLTLNIQGIDASADYSHDTATIGRFLARGTFTLFRKFDQRFSGGPRFSVLNTTGYNSTFGAPRLQARANLGWRQEPWAIDVFANHVGSYRNWSAGTIEPVVLQNGVPTGGGDKVRANTLYDLNIRYALSNSLRLAGSEISLDVQNLFNRNPAFYNSLSGYDGYTGNPIGRVITLALKLRL